jgi:hypothetical protein
MPTLRITLTDDSPREIIGALKAFTERVVRDNKLPPNEALSNSKPCVIGSVVTYDAKNRTGGG